MSVLSLLGVLAVLGAAYAVHAAGNRADFSISASRPIRTVKQGRSTIFTVAISRSGNFRGTIALSMRRLPGTRTNASFNEDRIGSGRTSSRVTIRTSPSTPAGRYRLRIIGTSGSVTRSTSVTLTVQAQSKPNFTLNATPTTQSAAQGLDTSYTIAINRSGGFTDAVSLSVSGLPAGATGSFLPGSGSSSSTLTVETSATTPIGTYTLTITGTASGLTRTTTATLKVVPTDGSFTISGDVGTTLYPGMPSAPLLLYITNPYQWDLDVSRLGVAVRAATSRPGCDGIQNVAVTQYSGPRTLPVGPSRTVSLRDLGVPQSQWPRIRMLDQPWNQDPCKGARFTFSYSGVAARSR